jgi:hypothetical protein
MRADPDHDHRQHHAAYQHVSTTAPLTAFATTRPEAHPMFPTDQPDPGEITEQIEDFTRASARRQELETQLPDDGEHSVGKRICVYVAPDMHAEQGYVPAIVTEGEPGYTPLTGNGPFAQPWYWGHDLTQAQQLAAQANARLGLSPEQVRSIIASSMAAQP